MRTVSHLLFAFAVILFPGCHNEAPPSYQNSIRINIPTDPPTLNPIEAHDSISLILSLALFDALMRKDLSGKITHSIAKTHSVSTDGKTYTFYLRDAQWSNQQPVTANDFVYTLQQILSPSSYAVTGYLYYPIKNAKKVKQGLVPINELGVKAIDPKTLVIELEHPTPYLLELFCTLFPVAEKIEQQHPKWAHKPSTFIGNGPFILQEWTPYSHITLKKNPLYWDKKAVQLKQVSISIVQDPGTELAMFEDHELDWAGPPFSLALPTDALDTLREQHQLYTDKTDSSYFYLLNTKIPPLSSKKVRHAMARVINRKSLIDHLVKGNQSPLTSFIPHHITGRKDPLFEDAEILQAKNLYNQGILELKEKKISPIPLTLIYNTSLGHHKIAQYVQEAWVSDLGMDVLLQNMEWKVFLSKINQADFMIARMGILPEFQDPIAFLAPFAQQGDYAKITQFSDPVFDQLLEKAKMEVDEKKRLGYLLRAEEILMEQMPIIPIYNHTESYIKNPKLQGVQLTPPVRGDLKWAYFE